jgi:hypothetical protein
LRESVTDCDRDPFNTGIFETGNCTHKIKKWLKQL